MHRLSWPFVAILTLTALSNRAAGEDLARVYPATLDHVEGAVARTWTCAPEDVWSLESFKLSYFGELDIDLGKAEVVFGKHGTNVV